MKKIIRLLTRYLPRRWLLKASWLLTKVGSFFYLGNNVFCPVCQGSFRKFLPYGVKTRENALCPKCLSLERHRLIWLYLKEKTNFFSAPLKVLHFAAEPCFRQKFKQLKNLDYLTADLDPALGDLKLDLLNIGLPDNQFDVVICNNVLEHVGDDRQAMRELYRILKPGGWALLQVPIEMDRSETYENPAITSPTAREKHFGQKDHLRVYGQDFPDRLKEAGFAVESHYFAKELSQEIRLKYKLREEEIIFIAKKSA